MIEKESEQGSALPSNDPQALHGHGYFMSDDATQEMRAELEKSANKGRLPSDVVPVLLEPGYWLPRDSKLVQKNMSSLEKLNESEIPAGVRPSFLIAKYRDGQTAYSD